MEHQAHHPPQIPVAPHGNRGDDRHADHTPDRFRRRFWICLGLTLPVLVFGHMLPGGLGYEVPPAARGLPALLGTAVFWYGGWPFLQGAFREVRRHRPGMMLLIAIAISVAFGFSVAVTAGLRGMPLWEELATLVTVMLLGHWLEMRAITQARGALGELAQLLPQTASRLTSAGAEEVPLAALRPGDRLLVRPGDSVPSDGVVLDGGSSVNEALLTGESRPVTKSPGDPVIAGAINGSGALTISVTAVGDATMLAGIGRLVAQAQVSKSSTQVLADRAAVVLTLIAVVAASATVIGWSITRAAPGFIIERAVAVLVVACPHALGLAIPLVVSISTTLGARHGLLFRERRGLEEARRLDLVVFDKTGTLTWGRHRLIEIVAAPTLSEAEALTLAAAVEAPSEHPVGHAIVEEAQRRGLAIPPAVRFSALSGRGVRAEVAHQLVMVGGPALLRELGVPSPAWIAALELRAARGGRSLVYLVRNGEILAGLAVADALRPESAEAVAALRQARVQVAMITGDARPVAERIGAELGISMVLAEVLPADKARQVEALRSRGHRVAMVGDGVNDAPALAAADVGIALGGGTGVAVESGDVILARNDPRDVLRLIELSRSSYRKMVQNLWWAAGYNVVAIPLAAGALAPWGVVLAPAAAAVLMSLSTIAVALNAQLLRRAPRQWPKFHSGAQG